METYAIHTLAALHADGHQVNEVVAEISRRVQTLEQAEALMQYHLTTWTKHHQMADLNTVSLLIARIKEMR